MFRAGVVVVALIMALPVALKARADSSTQLIAMWDSDHDKTLDLAEVNKAAAAEFDKLDVDHDDTLDMRELGHRITRAEFLAADKDRDGTLDKEEYEAIVTERFHATNRDNDTTIEAKELRTRAGRRLLALLM